MLKAPGSVVPDGSLLDLLGRHCENLSTDDPDLELVCVLVETV
jgi:hypothetical protein